MDIYRKLGVYKEGTIIACPNCSVCSICVEDHDGADTAVCKVCGQEIDLREYRN